MDDDELTLSAREFGVLAYLMSSPGRAVPKQELLDEVWNEPFGQANLVDRVHQNVTGRPAEVAMFWTAYIITRPLGASVADWLALPP
ncbi:MAG TPA: winged helix-turn-helix domain-containing protein [Candidatus Nanopelagicales bacterium]